MIEKRTKTCYDRQTSVVCHLFVMPMLCHVVVSGDVLPLSFFPIQLELELDSHRSCGLDLALPIAVHGPDLLPPGYQPGP